MNDVTAIARWTVRDLRTPVVALTLTTFGLSLMMALLFPVYRDSFADIEIPSAFEGLVGEVGSLGSPEGFLAAEVFSWLPVLITVFAVMWGTGTLAGDEAAGDLDLLLAQATTRRRLFVGKAVGITGALIVVTGAILPGLLLGAAVSDMNIGAGALVAATLAQVPLVVLYLAIGLCAAAALPHRRAATVVTTVALVAAYVVQILTGAIPDLADLEILTPLHWADASTEMIDGARPLVWVAMGAVAVAIMVAALALFERREIGSGQPRRRRAN